MNQSGLKAKVFISCGQREETNEVIIAKRIADELDKMGFESYVATSQQSLRGIKENIFKEIETSEYFIFIDFIREKILISGIKKHRGSLFSHQELALASYLDLPVVTFQEMGVKKDDGLIQFIQGNSTPFSERDKLPELVIELIKKLKWDPNWKNQLSISFDQRDFDDPGISNIGGNPLGRFFHLRVNNLHVSKPAFNCYAYLVSIKDVNKNTLRLLEIPEIKWKGFPFPNALIQPKKFRKLDAFYVKHSLPLMMEFNVFTDFTGDLIKIQTPGVYDLDYLIVSENFPSTEAQLRVSIGSTLDSIEIKIL